MTVRVSTRARGSPVFCILIPTDNLLYCTKRPSNHFACRTRQKDDGRRALHQNPALTVAVALNRTTTSGISRLLKNESDDCRPRCGSPVRASGEECFGEPDLR